MNSAADKTLRDHAFVKELTALINRHSMENGSMTPDFILADLLFDLLAAFNKATQARERWYGRERQLADPPVPALPVPGPGS